jgi:hypothetical protein
MSQPDLLYELQEQKSGNSLKFFFVSKGKRDVIKAIHYSMVGIYDGKNVFNLGFGDYDIQTNKITDNSDTNNGDHYSVFNTVLSTIPVFFEYFGQVYLIVMGSDGRPGFIKNCQLACTKKCEDGCKKFRRRITIYRGYVNKHFESLKIDFQFIGAFQNKKGQLVIEPYELHKAYDRILLFKRNA